jgi:glucose-1-phosphatase
MGPHIKQLLFDLGGVLFDIDYERPVQAFAGLGYADFGQMYSQAGANPLFEQLETGRISPDGFLRQMAALAPQPVAPAQITAAWNSILLGFRVPSLQYLQTLGQRYPLYLLSNTNAIHLVEIEAFCQQQTGRPSLSGFFEKAWYSHEVGLRKPDADVYRFVLQNGGFLASETLFIDDSVQNIEAAQQLGFDTHLLLPGEHIEALGLLT